MTSLVLQKLVASLEGDSTFGAVQPKIINAYDKRLIDSNDINEEGMLYGSAASRHCNDRYILYPIGACSVIRKATFQHIGGFYDDFFVGIQDVDLGWRLWLFGYKVKAVTCVEIYHSRGTFRRKNKIINLQLDYIAFKNQIAMVIQNFEAKNTVEYFLRLMLVLFSHVLTNAPRGYYEMMSTFWIARHLKLILKRRYLVQNLRKIPDEALIGMLKHIFPKPLNEAIREYVFKLVARTTIP